MAERTRPRILEFITNEAAKLIRRHQSYAFDQNDEAARVFRRRGLRPPVEVRSPRHWNADPGFDPYRVRARAECIAFAVSRALQDRSYRPRAAVTYPVPKNGGGNRDVSVFQVADNAVSNLVFRKLMEKNASRFSARCYAYRRDVSLHDAVAYVSGELATEQRLFVAEFDFRKYFDTISHAHLRSLLDGGRFVTTDIERRILEGFLSAPSFPVNEYRPNAAPREGGIGIPQGTSVSLFLANIAASPLDSALERLAVGFARYADDTVIWSSSYEDICKAVNELNAIARAMGVALNLKKSEGVSLLLSPDEPCEFAQGKTQVELLGHSMRRVQPIGPTDVSTRIGVRESTAARVKSKMSYLIYRNLLQDVTSFRPAPDRLLEVDADYRVLIRQLRRYLYGGVSEAQLRRYASGTVPTIRFFGLLSFFPLIDDFEQLKQLDGWLLRSIERAMAKRVARLGSVPNPPTPHGLTGDMLAKLRVPGTGEDLRVPSLVRFGRVLRRACTIRGLNVVAPPTYAGSLVLGP